MFGFLNTKREQAFAGSEISRDRKRRERITYSVLGIIVLLLLNLILYGLTRF